jgi:intracellular sulfur oxidation DsrE/DsrF family protein
MSTSEPVVVHITSDDTGNWEMALRNLVNLVRGDAVGTSAADVEVVVNGPAVQFFMRSGPEAAKIRQMIDAGVEVAVCSNSLSRFGYDASSLVAGAEVVPSGVAEVVRAQQAGKNYLKLP